MSIVVRLQQIDDLHAENATLASKLADKQAELNNVYPLLVSAEEKNAAYARELNLLRQDQPRFEDRIDELIAELRVVTDERDNALREVDRLADRVNSLEEWAREPLTVRKATS